MNLAPQVGYSWISEPLLARIEEDFSAEGFRWRNLNGVASEGGSMRLDASGSPGLEVTVTRELEYLRAGDILRLSPARGQLRVLYRRHSPHNFLFFTERCNSRCLMCSQPPREIDDSYLVEDILRAIPHMSPDTRALGITGGEPTLLGQRLVDVLASAKRHLPNTAIHVLSNGRLLSDLALAQKIGAVGHPDLMIGVPLYADTADVHDFVVQSRGAYGETLLGLMNLARAGVRIELRMVIHRETLARLVPFARFVVRNLPFVDQVVFMGLEITGFAKTNLEALWVDPADYQDQLEEAVHLIDDAGMRGSIYNHQLCVLRSSLHRFAVRSISDWKNIYLDECRNCSMRDTCGGLFASGTIRHSAHIHAIHSAAASLLA